MYRKLITIELMNLAMPGILIEIIESIARDDISFNVPQTIDTKPDL